MSKLPPCPKCNSEYVYEDENGSMVCPECSHEWKNNSEENTAENQINVKK